MQNNPATFSTPRSYKVLAKQTASETKKTSQLPLELAKRRWTTRGSNPRPSACKADALPLLLWDAHSVKFGKCGSCSVLAKTHR
ncbi:hypothetical protein AUEXF2481DRAFT_562671 [Aureobasidium subglaciale EXF-2481]|uniref:Uncharacterized protein n=1 Tax=Aureobasidium subglaciale (strain EXF-2481) TaxID=1043005 RepID=A0A074YK04_AURSE|nr:uncharacterized protein AUEXF2481DRAFT_562671 [Aureobasidium subglaciale EXF-2481]KEQ98030.1 hypothetical protein AUEXF2481DRAFT_562671 [Aureobasidium subglaciale EXF-2481]